MSSESKSFRTCPLFSRLALLLVTLACLPLLASGAWWKPSQAFGPELCLQLEREYGFYYDDRACQAVVAVLRQAQKRHNDVLPTGFCYDLYWNRHRIHWLSNENWDWDMKIWTRNVCMAAGFSVAYRG